MEAQRAIAEANDAVEADQCIALRIGVHLGDITVAGDDIFGDGVNIAARLQEGAATGGVSLFDDVFRQVDGKLEADFEDLGEQTFKNITKPIWVYRVRTDDVAPAASLPLPSKPSIAVLPFTNMSNDPDQEYFSDGITENIITVLAQVRWLFVISSNSCFTYKGGATDLKKVAEALGVRYILEGSVRRAGNRVRITAQLIEARPDHHIWAERFDGNLEDIFALQDEITETIVTAIVPQVDEAETARAQRRPVASLDAWDLYLRGLWQMTQRFGEDQDEVRALFRKFIELDPRLAFAHAALARSLLISVVMGTVESPAEALEEAGTAVTRATELDDRDSYAHAILSRVHSAKGEFDAAVEQGQTAVALYLNDATAHYYLAWAMYFGGQPSDTLLSIEAALRLNRRGPETYAYLSVGAAALIMLNRF
ncbi:MAG: adenylate/guanylate cyclase domain-containing protein [Alphaproteobacteria bacterium]